MLDAACAHHARTSAHRSGHITHARAAHEPQMRRNTLADADTHTHTHTHTNTGKYKHILRLPDTNRKHTYIISYNNKIEHS